MRMRCLFLVGLLALFVGQVPVPIHAKEDKSSEGVILEAELKNAGLKQEGGETVLRLDLHMVLRNVGSRPILRIREAEPHFRCGRLLKVGAASSEEDRCLFFNYFGESVNTSAEMKARRQALEQGAVPPTELIQIIQPGEQLEFDESFSFFIPNQKSISGSYCKSEWSEVQSQREILFSGTLENWSFNLESNPNRSENRFGKLLRKRWEKSGWLMLDPIWSKPIRIDLAALQLQK